MVSGRRGGVKLKERIHVELAQPQSIKPDQVRTEKVYVDLTDRFISINDIPAPAARTPSTI